MPAKTALDRMAERAARIAEGQARHIAHVYSAEKVVGWLAEAETREATLPPGRQQRSAAREAALYRRARWVQDNEPRVAVWEDLTARGAVHGPR